MIDIDTYFDRYLTAEGLLPGRVEAVGQYYREDGFLDREQLHSLISSVSPSSARHVKKNAAQDCRETTADIHNLQYDASKVSVLNDLHGVKVPTASYILTALDPLRHSPLTQDVWHSLKYLGYVDGGRNTFSPIDYATAIHHIRTIAREEGRTAAAVGYALAAHGKDVRDRADTDNTQDASAEQEWEEPDRIPIPEPVTGPQ